MTASMWRRVLRGASANAFTQLIIACVQLSLVPTLASRWGLQLYGWWILISTIPSYLALSDLGFAAAAGAEMTMAVARNERAKAIVTFQNARAAIAGLSVLILILTLSLIWSLPDRFLEAPNTLSPQSARLTITLLTLQSIIALQSGPLLAGFRSTELYAFGEYTQSFIFLAEGLAAILAGLTGRTPLFVAAALMICRAIGVSTQAWLLAKKTPWLSFDLNSVSWDGARHLFKPSAGVFALTAAQITFLQGTTFAVGAASSTSAAGIFSAVRTLTRIGVQMTGLVNRSLAPEYSVVAARGASSSQARILLVSLLVSISLLVPTALLLVFFGKQIVQIWTHGTIKPSWALIHVMTAVMVVNGIWNPISNLLLASNRHGELAYKYLALSIMSVALAYLLALHYGELGGGVSLLALDLSTACIVCRMATRLIVTPRQLFETLDSDWRRVGQRAKLYFTKS